MKTSMMRALVITVAVLALGFLSMTKVSGQGVRGESTSAAPQEATAVQNDPQKAYLDSYKTAFDKAKSDTQKALESTANEEGSSGGSCG